MSQKAIKEADGKLMMAKWMPEFGFPGMSCGNVVKITSETNLEQLDKENPWLLKQNLVAKPDQLIKRRGKGDMLKLDAPWAEIKTWVQKKMGVEVDVEGTKGVLRSFIVEPFCAHTQDTGESPSAPPLHTYKQYL